MQIDRGFIKWQPFDSVTSTKKILKDLIQEKNKVSMPNLTDEQIEKNENLLLTAFHNDEFIKIKYFKSNKINIITTKIKKIDSITKKIILTNNTTIYFSQIVYVSN